MANLTEVLKQAAIQAVEASDPAGITFGTVESVGPLSIRIDQKVPLPGDFFLLTSNVRPHTVNMTAEHYTGYSAGGEGEEAYAKHRHDFSGTKEYRVNNGLCVGDRVLLLRQQGGQLYVVLDRLEAGA